MRWRMRRRFRKMVGRGDKSRGRSHSHGLMPSDSVPSESTTKKIFKAKIFFRFVFYGKKFRIPMSAIILNTLLYCRAYFSIF